MRHTIVIEIDNGPTHAQAERAVTQHINNISAYSCNRIRARVVEYHQEQMTEPAPTPQPQWCSVCKAYHVNAGESTDAGIITRACPKVPTNDSRYYGSPVYTGTIPAPPEGSGA